MTLVLRQKTIEQLEMFTEVLKEELKRVEEPFGVVQTENVKHSSKTDKHYTPLPILQSVRNVLGKIDLDPASDEIGNKLVQAKKIITEEEDGLKTNWEGNDLRIFLNPPGSKLGNKSLQALFWKKLMDKREESVAAIRGAFFLSFNLESLQVTQNYGCKPISYFPMCIFKERIRFYDSEGNEQKQPTHANLMAYVPPLPSEFNYYRNSYDIACFAQEFAKFGSIIIPKHWY